ncbi:MAG TPA: phage protein Gp37 [Acidiferrobacterales bacterium]|nr:phage protein Gp37 [Acidiferrobacterales bacterium]
MLAELENELLAAVRDSALGPRLKKIDILPRITPDVIKSLATEAPAVYVAINSLLVDDHRVQNTIDVLCLARNARGHVEARHGDGQTIGLYQIVDAMLALTGPGSTHGFKTKSARIDADPVWEAAGLNAAGMVIEVHETVPAEVDVNSLAPFLTFHAEHSLVAGELEPAAIDEVTLPQ